MQLVIENIIRRLSFGWTEILFQYLTTIENMASRLGFTFFGSFFLFLSIELDVDVYILFTFVKTDFSET